MQSMKKPVHKCNPLPSKSSNLPPTIGAAKALIAKHCENSAMDSPRCSVSVSEIIASVAVGKKAARPNAIGNCAISTRIAPL